MPLRYRLRVGFHLYFCVVVRVDAQLLMQREHVKPEGGVLADQSQRFCVRVELTRCYIFGEVHVRVRRRVRALLTDYGVATA